VATPPLAPAFTTAIAAVKAAELVQVAKAEITPTAAVEVEEAPEVEVLPASPTADEPMGEEILIFAPPQPAAESADAPMSKMRRNPSKRSLKECLEAPSEHAGGVDSSEPVQRIGGRISKVASYGSLADKLAEFDMF
jgi:hypothetical protein